MNDEEAEQLSILLLQTMAKLNESAAFVRDKDTDEHWDVYRKAVGRAMGIICLELQEPLWQRFQTIKPEKMGGSYKLTEDIYEPKFYDFEQ
jgi:hypothetical protein